MCLLVDERPEEVTDMERSIHGEVVSSTFDMPSENHIAVAELVHGAREAPRGERLRRRHPARLDHASRPRLQPRARRRPAASCPAASTPPRSTRPRSSSARRATSSSAASLTILATALVDTGSKMDEVIFEEFKGTGNMELRLDRRLADRRIFPAIDVITSGTRKEELLLDPIEAPFVWGLRRILHGVDSAERAIDMLIKGLKQTRVQPASSSPRWPRAPTTSAQRTASSCRRALARTWRALCYSSPGCPSAWSETRCAYSGGDPSA